MKKQKKYFTNKTKPANDIVYGVHTIESLIRFQPERIKKIFIARKSLADDWCKKAQEKNISFSVIERSELEEKFSQGSKAQGLVALVKPFVYADFEDIFQRQANKVLVVDSWQDPVNLGRAARSALCFGVNDMIICKDRSAKIDANAEKAAVGALSRINVYQVTNLQNALTKLKNKGFFVYGAADDGDMTLEQTEFAKKSAIIIGQEGKGLRPLTKKNCDALVKIDMKNVDICLNAADAACIFMYRLSQSE